MDPVGMADSSLRGKKSANNGLDVLLITHRDEI